MKYGKFDLENIVLYEVDEYENIIFPNSSTVKLLVEGSLKGFVKLRYKNNRVYGDFLLPPEYIRYTPYLNVETEEMGDELNVKVINVELVNEKRKWVKPIIDQLKKQKRPPEYYINPVNSKEIPTTPDEVVTILKKKYPVLHISHTESDGVRCGFYTVKTQDFTFKIDDFRYSPHQFYRIIEEDIENDRITPY